MVITNKEYVHILDFFQSEISSDKNEIKEDAEKILNKHLCKTIIGNKISVTSISKKKLKNSRKKR
tara:strand:+ start:36 stop:230 length:195 start_codon:yes stop_codon:yes gene_type:complete